MFYSSVKKKGNPAIVTWMNLEGIMLSEKFKERQI